MTVTPDLQHSRGGHVRELAAVHSAKLLVLAWFLVMAMASAWLPAYNAAAAAAAALLANVLAGDTRGSPLFLFFGVVLWASWAVLVLSTAVLSRTSWNRAGLAVTLLVVLVGLFMVTAQID